MEAGPCFVPDTVLLELAWVLKSIGGQPPDRVGLTLAALLAVPTIHVADAGRIRQALDDAAAGLDMADVLHRALAVGTDRLVTFDREFARRAAGRDGVPVVEP